MGQPSDVTVDMKPIPVDDHTLDRLFSGTLDPDDAPPGYAPVARLLQAAAAPVVLGARQGTDAAGTGPGLALADPAREQQQIAAMVMAITAPSGQGAAPKPRRSLLSRAKLGGLVVAGVLFGSTGLAFAGALPGPAQNLASTVLSKVGISVPHGHSKLSQNPNGTATPAAKPSQGPDPNGPAMYGLCNAYASGQGGTNGEKDNSVAFQNLAKAAGSASNIAAFCKGATPGGKPQTTNQGKGHGNGHNPGQHGPPAQAQAKGRGRGGPGRVG